MHELYTNSFQTLHWDAMNFIHLKWKLCNSKLCTPSFKTLYNNIWNFILLNAKLYHNKNCFETYQHGSTFIDLIIINVMVQTELKIDTYLTRKLSHFKVFIPHAYSVWRRSDTRMHLPPLSRVPPPRLVPRQRKRS